MPNLAVDVQPLRAVLFDAVGTLLFAEPSVVDVYAQVGRQCGSNVSPPEIAARFKAAIAEQDELDRQVHALRTDESREIDRWRCIIAATLGAEADVESALKLLWQHFACAASWRLDPAAAELFELLERRKLLWGLASNFDGRLPAICRGIPALANCRHVFVSSEVGWRKPSPNFFRAIENRLGFPPQSLLLVGDDLANDYLAARAAGWQAVLVGPPNLAGDEARVDRLHDLIELLARV